MSLLSQDMNLTFLQMCKHSFKVVFDGQLTPNLLPQSGIPRGFYRSKYEPRQRGLAVHSRSFLVHRRE